MQAGRAGYELDRFALRGRRAWLGASRTRRGGLVVALVLVVVLALGLVVVLVLVFVLGRRGEWSAAGAFGSGSDHGRNGSGCLRAYGWQQVGRFVDVCGCRAVGCCWIEGRSECVEGAQGRAVDGDDAAEP